MSWIKLIFINIMVFLFLFGVLEVGAGFARLLLGKDFKVPLAVYFEHTGTGISSSSPSHPCNEMKADVLLDHVPHTRQKCFPKDGMVIGDYVVYNSNNLAKEVILTLGGSTTSGFYQHISNGNTWPKLLAEKTANNFKIVNGGVGAYSSLQELYKFIRDGSRFENLRYVISLNGINDMPDYHGPNDMRSVHYPYLTEQQFNMNNHQRWFENRIDMTSAFMPNITTLFNYMSNNGTFLNGAEVNINGFEPVNAADRWQKNVERLNSLVLLENAKYFVFLQPALGLIGVQSLPMSESPDELLLQQFDKGAILQIRSLYRELKVRCALLSYCFDISNLAPPTGNMYNDPRHHNENGNAVIAEEIWSVIRSEAQVQ